MSKKTELAKNTIIITIGKICTQFLQFFMLPLYTSCLSPEEYGTADLVITYTSLFLPLVILQLDQAVFRFLIDAREDENAKKVNISTTFYFTFFLILCCSLVFFAVQFFIDSVLKYYLLMNLIANMCSHVMLQISRGLGDNTTYSIAGFISAAAQIMLNILLLVVMNYGAEAILISPVAGNFIAALFVFIRKKLNRFLSMKSFDKKQLKILLSYSVPLIPNALSWWVLGASDRIIITAYLGPAVNGLVTVGHKIPGAFQSVYTIFNMSWTESVSVHINDKGSREFFSEVINNMFRIFSCAAIAIIACLPFVYDFLVDSAYKESEHLVPFFMIAAMFNVVQGLYSCVYVALKKTKEIAVSTVISAVINVVSHIILIGFTGMYAAPLSTILGYGVMTFYRYFDIRKHIDISLKTSSVISVVFLTALTVASYYIGNKLISAVVLFVVLLYSIISNKDFLKSAFSIIRTKMKNRS